MILPVIASTTAKTEKVEIFQSRIGPCIRQFPHSAYLRATSSSNHTHGRPSFPFSAHRRVAISIIGSQLVTPWHSDDYCCCCWHYCYSHVHSSSRPASSCAWDFCAEPFHLCGASSAFGGGCPSGSHCYCHRIYRHTSHRSTKSRSRLQ